MASFSNAVQKRTKGACAESTRHGFVQRVVVDTGSTDATMEIARAHGVNLHEMEWPDSFSAARNHSIRFAENAVDYVAGR